MVEASCPPLPFGRTLEVLILLFFSCDFFLRRAAEVLVGQASTTKKLIRDSFERAESGSGLRMFFFFSLAEKRGVMTTSE